MKISTQAESFGLEVPPERTASAEPNPEILADMLRGPRLQAGTLMWGDQ